MIQIIYTVQFRLRGKVNIDAVVNRVISDRPVIFKKWRKWSDAERFNQYTLSLSASLQEVDNFLPSAPKTPETIEHAFQMVIDKLHKAAKVIPVSKFKPHLKPY